MRAELSQFVHDETNLVLEVDLGDLEDELVEVEAVDVESARHLQSEVEVEEEIEAQVLVRSRSGVRVRVLIDLCADRDDGLVEQEAPVRLLFAVSAIDAHFFASVCADQRACL